MRPRAARAVSRFAKAASASLRAPVMVCGVLAARILKSSFCRDLCVCYRKYLVLSSTCVYWAECYIGNPGMMRPFTRCL